MADMITRCPQCATAFRITAAHLKLAQGSVRCGACFTIFNALENLSERSTSNAPASNLADDFLISDHMGIEDESSETSAEASTKSSLFERVEQAKAQPEKSEEADESWAIALLSEEGLAEVHASDDEFLEEEPSFRPFSPGPSDKPIELSDDFLRATQKAQAAAQTQAREPQPPATAGAPQQAGADNAPADSEQDWATSLAEEHPELNADDLKDLQNALEQSRQEPVFASNRAEPAADFAPFSATAQVPGSRNAHLIERIELDPLEVTVRQRKGLSPQFWWSLGGLCAMLALLLQVAIIKMPQWRYDTPLSG
ncbi:MAG TPA: zinc-ribbon domain-containing protein, partial [Marinagarivorans sp.]|nr:zinc-ribbon domain-containing protein [Marinagarivorans sp.]